MESSKSKAGRPTVITPDTVRKLKTAFELDLTVEGACNYAGISKDTYYRHLKEKEFSDEMRIAQMHLEIEAKKSVTRGVKEDGNLALKVLERRCKEQYSPRHEHSIDGELTISQIVMGQSKRADAARVDWDEGGLDVVQGGAKGKTQNWIDE